MRKIPRVDRRTSCPPRSNREHNALPTKPVAPVTSTFIGRDIPGKPSTYRPRLVLPKTLRLHTRGHVEPCAGAASRPSTAVSPLPIEMRCYAEAPVNRCLHLAQPLDI